MNCRFPYPPLSLLLLITLYQLTGCSLGNVANVYSAPLNGGSQTPNANQSHSLTITAPSTQAVPSTPALTNTPDLMTYYSRTQPPEPELTPILTPGPVHNPGLVLPDNLQLEEFSISEDINYHEFLRLIVARHPESGARIRLPAYTSSEITYRDGPFTLNTEPLARSYKLTMTFTGHQDFEMECKSSVGPFQAAGYSGEHWFVETYCDQISDIISDGVSLNGAKGYDRSVGFQRLDGQPLYLYEKNGRVGFFFNGVETMLDYDRLAISYCGEPKDCYPLPAHFEHMIAFTAYKGKQLYYVAIGQFLH